MSINLINSLKLLITKNTLLRDLQINECTKIKVNGLSLEFGATDRKNKTFSNFIRGQSKFEFSNVKPNKKLNIFYSNLTKKLKIKSNKYNNILLFNVLEHLPEYRIALSQINRILKKKKEKSLAQLLLFIKYMVHRRIILDLLKFFLSLNLKNKNLTI